MRASLQSWSCPAAAPPCAVSLLGQSITLLLGPKLVGAAVVVGHCRSVVRNASDNGWVHTLAAEVDCMRAQYASESMRWLASCLEEKGCCGEKGCCEGMLGCALSGACCRLAPSAPCSHPLLHVRTLCSMFAACAARHPAGCLLPMSSYPFASAVWASLSPPTLPERIFDLLITLNLLTQVGLIIT